MTVAQFVNDRRGPVISVKPTDKVNEVLQILAAKRIGCVPVVADDQVVGIFSERDVVNGLANDGFGFLDRAVSEVMTASAITIAPDTPVLTALSLMTMQRIRHLPIVSDKRMVGFVSIGDLVKSRIDRIEAEAAAMRAYIQSA